MLTRWFKVFFYTQVSGLLFWTLVHVLKPQTALHREQVVRGVDLSKSGLNASTVLGSQNMFTTSGMNNNTTLSSKNSAHAEQVDLTVSKTQRLSRLDDTSTVLGSQNVLMASTMNNSSPVSLPNVLKDHTEQPVLAASKSWRQIGLIDSEYSQNKSC
jgi:hypothetical protein